MDFKKKLSGFSVLGFLDGLVEKIPEPITDILKKVVLGIFAIMVLFAIYYGWDMGKNSASEEGQHLAKDTKALFKEELTKEYNRTRRDIRMPDSNSLIGENEYKHKMEVPYDMEQFKDKTISNSDNKLLERENPVRTNKNADMSPPLKELNENDYQSISKESDLPGVMEGNRPGKYSSKKREDRLNEDFLDREEEKSRIDSKYKKVKKYDDSKENSNLDMQDEKIELKEKSESKSKDRLLINNKKRKEERGLAPISE